MILLEIIFLAALMLLGAIGLIEYQKKNEAERRERRKPRKKDTWAPPIPPDLPVGGPERLIRTHDIGNFWQEIGRPTEIGTQVEVNMNSGMVAIYELVHKEQAEGTDWNWYDLEFVRYKDSPSSSPNRT